jgi:hypothetical protein
MEGLKGRSLLTSPKRAYDYEELISHDKLASTLCGPEMKASKNPIAAKKPMVPSRSIRSNRQVVEVAEKMLPIQILLAEEILEDSKLLSNNSAKSTCLVAYGTCVKLRSEFLYLDLLEPIN